MTHIMKQRSGRYTPHTVLKPIKSIDVSKNTETVDSKETPDADSPPCIERKKSPFDHQFLPRMALGGPCITE